MQVGDLVKIAPHCKNKGRMAIVVRTETWERTAVWIKYMDLVVDPWKDASNDNGYARIANLILISEVSNESR